MIEMICVAGHSVQVPHAIPECLELMDDGFCLAPCWQPPAKVRTGTIVALLDGRRIVRAIVDTWNGDPDRQALLVDEFGTTQHRLLDSWFTAEQPGPWGQPLMRFADVAELKAPLMALLTEARQGRKDASRQQLAADLARAVAADEKPSRRGHLHETDIPFVMYKEGQPCHESPDLSFHLWGKERFERMIQSLPPRYREVMLLNFHQGMGPAQIRDHFASTSTPVTKGNAKVLLHRARRQMRDALLADENRRVSPVTPEVAQPEEAGEAS